MNLILETPCEIESFTETTINESTGKEEKSYYIQGIFSTAGEKNKNGRIYPLDMWKREVERYQKEINEKSINSLMELEHPARTNVSLADAVARICELKLDGKYVMGKAKILNNNAPITNQIKALLDEGIKIGVSSRGVGNVGIGGVVNEYKLITYDLVQEPSNYGSFLSKINESFLVENGIIMDTEYSLDNKGNIIQNPYTRNEKKKFGDLLLQYINNL